MTYTAAVITVSDKGARGERVDTSGPALQALLEARGLRVVYTAMVPDERESIQAELRRCADEKKVNLVLTTGGTGFSPRDVTPEATKAVIERETPGIPEAMRAASMQLTPRGCLSRSAAGIRGGTLIINLPGSEKAARENLLAVVDAVDHGLDMLGSAGSADCAAPAAPAERLTAPSMESWLQEAKQAPNAKDCGMYLFHCGVVRERAKAEVRQGLTAAPVTGMDFDYDEALVAAAVESAKAMPGIAYVRVWLNRGTLSVGDDIMRVLIGGDIRPRVVDALNALVGTLKNSCVREQEHF